MNMPILTYIKEISPRPVLLIHGEKAHSRYFSETAYAAAASRRNSDRPGRQPRRSVRPPGQDPVRRYTRIGRIENPSGLARTLGPGDVRVSFSRP
jgi:fermentation-respiration switch protein FrsA (DUF1100 family)